MASFKDLADTKALTHLHADTIVVLVEGKSDMDFLKRMFPGMESDIRFEEVGSCTAMKERLQDERTRNPKVIGLLDRDTLKRDRRWDELFEIDNDNFKAATWVDGLYVLTRWEIENYLCELAAIYRLFSDWKPTEFPNEDALLDKMIETALDELHVTAGWCTAHDRGLSRRAAPGPLVDAGTLDDHVRKWIASCAPGALADYDHHLSKIKAFDMGGAVGKHERLAALLRMVDGKRLVKRIGHWLGVGKDKDPALQLASNVGGTAGRSDDLFHLMDSLRRRA